MLKNLQLLPIPLKDPPRTDRLGPLFIEGAGYNGAFRECRIAQVEAVQAEVELIFGSLVLHYQTPSSIFLRLLGLFGSLIHGVFSLLTGKRERRRIVGA